MKRCFHCCRQTGTKSCPFKRIAKLWIMAMKKSRLTNNCWFNFGFVTNESFEKRRRATAQFRSSLCAGFYQGGFLCHLFLKQEDYSFLPSLSVFTLGQQRPNTNSYFNQRVAHPVFFQDLGLERVITCEKTDKTNRDGLLNANDEKLILGKIQNTREIDNSISYLHRRKKCRRMSVKKKYP